MGLLLNHQNKQSNKTIQSPEGGGSSLGGGAKHEIAELAKTLIIFFSIAFFLRAGIVEAFKIPSKSMEPTLLIGDHILVNKLSYGFRLPLIKKTVFQFSSPKRGDIVVFTRPDNPLTPEEDESDTNIIKRVLAVAGDTIEVKGDRVYVNEKQIVENDYTVWWEYGGRKSFAKQKVPEGRIFLMGDNRDNSKDSRYWDEPFLEVSRVKGRAFIIYWSSKFLFGRIFKVLH